MDIRQLEYFVQAARLNSFSRAAESLYITQPTISKMIRNLETELGADLFYREGKSIRLTDAGELLLVKAQNIVESFASLSSELDILQPEAGAYPYRAASYGGGQFFSGGYRGISPALSRGDNKAA